MTLFDRIKKVSKERGYSIAEVERKAGISPNYLYQWKKRSPSPESLSDVAKVLNVSVDYLLGNDDKPEWADKKDYIDLNDFLNDNLRVNMAFNGENLTEEEIERLKVAMTQIFWDKRKREK